MKRVHAFAAALAAVLIGGCGGATFAPTNTGLAPLTRVGVEAVFVGAPTGQVMDPENIEYLESIQFRLVGFRGTTKVTLSPDLWQTSDSAGTYGTLAGNSGLLLAGEKASPVQTVYTSFEGNTYSATYRINPRQVRLSGNVLDEVSSTGVANIVIAFYGPGGIKLGQVRTMSDGTFLASIPPTTESFQIMDESLPVTAHRSFTYNGVRYDTGRFECKVTLPVYESGPKDLPFDILLTPKSVGPKPDPDGCAP